MKTVKFVPIATAFVIAVTGLAHPETGWAKSTRDTIKDWVEEGSDALKKGINELGDDFNAIQDYLNNYHWKGILQDKATSGAATLKHLELNDHSRAIIVKPGESIEAEVKCILETFSELNHLTDPLAHKADHYQVHHRKTSLCYQLIVLA